MCVCIQYIYNYYIHINIVYCCVVRAEIQIEHINVVCYVGRVDIEIKIRKSWCTADIEV